MRTKAWATVLAIVTMVLAPTSAFAQQVSSTEQLTPFSGSETQVFIAQAPEGATQTQFYEAVQNDDGAATFEPAFNVSSLRVNAVAFNAIDRLIYAYVQRSADASVPDGSIVAIGQNGDYARIGTGTFVSAEGTTLLNAGDVDPNGIYYLHRSDTGSRSLTVERVDLSTGLSLGRVDLTSVGTTGMPDFVWDSGYLVGLGADGRFVRIDPVAATVDYFAAPASMPVGIYGGAWRYGNGNVGFSFNGGGIYQVRVADIGSTPTFTLVNRIDGPGSFNNDGTAIPATPVDLSIEKTAAFVDASQHRIAYTVTVTNNGAGISSGHTFSDPIVADFGDVSVDDPACSVTARVLTCSSGPLDVGESRSYTFVATPALVESGRCYVNRVTVTGNEQDPIAANNASSAEVCNVPVLTVTKSVDPASGTTVAPGQDLDYSLVFTNTGLSDATVAHDDVLSDVLDDATITSAPVASSNELTASEITDGRFSVTGTLGAGATVTVSYSVTVNDDSERGNDQLDNFVLQAGAMPPSSCDATNGLCTTNPVASLAVDKSSDPLSGSVVDEGDVITYTVTFTNDSVSPNGSALVDHTDTLASVLDDATIAAEPTASDPALSVTRSGDQIRVIGQVPSGASLTVTYAVTVKAYADQGDHVLTNFVTVTGEKAPTACDIENPLCTEHATLSPDHAVAVTSAAAPDNAQHASSPTAPRGLATTGAGIASTIAAMVLLFIVGGTLIALRRRTSGA